MKKDFLSILLISLFSLSFWGCDSSFWNKFSNKKEGTPWVEKTDNKPMTVPWKGQAISADTFVEIARVADLGVVNVGSTQIIKQPKRRSPFFFGPQERGQSPFDDLFRHFFDDFSGEEGPGQDIKRASLGSGFVINEDGLIVTNNHVVEKASEITVTIGKDHEYKAKVVGTDPKTDVALIKINPKEKLTPLALGDSDQLRVGEIVVAIGNPFGLAHTVTQGIVSAKERSIGFGPYDNFIQTDASINFGNSGGPLLNLKAEVVGINAAIVASAQGIGFAIPVNLAKSVISQLRDKGSVTRGWLGVYIQKVDPDLAKSLDLKDRRGALVAGVQENSPAKKAGIQVRDVVVKYAGKEIKDFNELPLLVAQTPVGKKVDLEVIRDGKSMTFSVVIGKLEASEEEKAKTGEKDSEPSGPDRLGLTVGPLTQSRSKDLNLEVGTKGVVVEKVKPSSPAAEKGIQPGDVIIEFNRKPVPDVKSYANISKSLKKGDMVLLLIKRGAEGTQFLAFPLE